MLKAVTYLVAILPLVLNPFFACSGNGYRFGMRDIRAALDGTWSATVYSSDGPKTVTFMIKPGRVEQHARRGGLVPSAAACGHRDLVASAEACGDTTAVPLILLALDGTTTAGSLWIGGLDFVHGELKATIAGEEIRAYVTRSGEVRDIQSGVAVTLVHAPSVALAKGSPPGD